VATCPSLALELVSLYLILRGADTHTKIEILGRGYLDIRKGLSAQQRACGLLAVDIMFQTRLGSGSLVCLCTGLELARENDQSQRCGNAEALSNFATSDTSHTLPKKHSPQSPAISNARGFEHSALATPGACRAGLSLTGKMQTPRMVSEGVGDAFSLIFRPCFIFWTKKALPAVTGDIS